MLLLGDEPHVEARFSPFGDSASLDVDRCTVCAERHHRLRNCFGRARWNSYVMWVMSNLLSIRLETVLVSLHDKCTVCAKHTMAQKSFWMHQMVLLGDETQVQACFGLFRDSTSLDAR